MSSVPLAKCDHYQVSNHKTEVKDISDGQSLEIEACVPVEMLPGLSEDDQVGYAAEHSWRNAIYHGNIYTH